jgi:hypothetical protein
MPNGMNPARLEAVCTSCHARSTPAHAEASQPTARPARDRLGGPNKTTSETPRFVARIGVGLWNWPCGQQFRPQESKDS